MYYPPETIGAGLESSESKCDPCDAIMQKTKPIIGIQLDLKGMRFKPSYTPQYLADLASQGINTLLVEYEDAFPFEGLNIASDPATVWSPATLRRFTREAQRRGIEIIPLQQCLAHLEYVLAWKRYRHLAENRAYPSTIRLADPRGIRLLTGMLRQVIDAHPHSRYIHLGMDEAHALPLAAKRLCRDPLDLFLDHLRALLPIVEAAGKKAIIWGSMIESHFKPGALDEFRGRICLATGNYAPHRELSPYCKLRGGLRISRAWLKDPEDPAAPAIGPGTLFTEDYPPAIRKLVAPYQRGKMFVPLLQLDLWREAGVDAIAISAVRLSEEHAVLPRYNARLANIACVGAAALRSRQLGHIGTSWARGTSWCPPNYCIDLQWPLVAAVAESMGGKPKAFWPGIPAKTVTRLIRTLGRSRDDWRLELQVADEMDRLAPRLRAHRFEWQSIALMARVLALHRQADYNLLEVEYFHANSRPVDSEWTRRLHEQRLTLRAIAAMRRRVRDHFGRRYVGAAFEEWLRHLFDLHEERLHAATKVCRKKQHTARHYYE